MSDAMQGHVGDRPTTGTPGAPPLDKLANEAIPKVGEYPAKTSSQPVASDNVFSEFGHAVYQSGIERPLNSLKQLVGMQVESAKPEPELHGAMEVAQVVGSATGQIVDFMLLSKFADGALNMNKVAASAAHAAGAESATLKALTHNQVARATFTSASVGFVNGAFLTPLNDGESGYRRLGNGLVDAGSFAMMGGLRAGLAPGFGEGLVGRITTRATAGAVGGATEAVLNPLTHGQLPDAESVGTNALSWAAGSVIGGEALRGAGKGLSAVKNVFALKPVEFTSPAEKAVPPVTELTKLATPEAQIVPPIPETLPAIFKNPVQVAHVFENAPHEAGLMDQLGASYSEKLAALGLPNTATPIELFKEVAKTSSQVSAYKLGWQTHTFDDGSTITGCTYRLGRYGQSGQGRRATFSTPGDASIAYKTVTWGSSAPFSKWSFETPSVSGTVGENGRLEIKDRFELDVEPGEVASPADKVLPVTEADKTKPATPETTTRTPITNFLPEIFENSNQLAGAFEKIPNSERALMNQLGVSYTEKLSALGLPNTATPRDLFDKIRGDRSTEVSRGNSHVQTHTFDDGSTISERFFGNPVLHQSRYTFATPDGASLTLEKATHDSPEVYKNTTRWSFQTPSMSGTISDTTDPWR
jgi:hypothetical protein